MNKKDITDAVIANSKKIYELGGRFEVEEGDWALYRSGVPQLIVDNVFLTQKKNKAIRFNMALGHALVKDIIPTWSARKCERLLIEKGWIMELQILQDEPRYYLGLRRTGSVSGDYKYTFCSELGDIVYQEALIKTLKPQPKMKPVSWR